MASDYTVGDLVAEFLSACGVSTVFGIASVHNIPMLDGIGRRNAIRFMMARGELGGAHMADGYARASGGLGVIFSSTGPGAANAVGGLFEARFAASPVLHITGQTATKFADRELGTVHDAYDQLGMLGSVSKSAYRIRSAQQALGVLTRAATEALTPPMGPVSIEVPIDIQRTPIPRPDVLDAFVLPLAPPRAPADIELDELAARVRRARRPLLWVGAGARHCGAEVRRLLDLGFTMINSLQGRGVVPEDDPRSLGALHGNGMPGVQEFYQTVDLMIAVGARVRGQETGDFAVKLPPHLIQIDIDPMANGRTHANEYFVCGDSQLALRGLIARIEGDFAVDPAYQREFADMKQRVRTEFLASLGVYGTFPEQLRKVLPRDAIFVRDITQSHSTWGNRVFPLNDPHQNIYPVSAGIGQGLQLGIGAAAAANGRKTLVLTGDGGFFLNVGELWTAVQEKLDVTIVVMNDQGYGVIKRIQDATQGRRFFADLQSPDLGRLAALSDIPFWKVERAADFGATVGKALAHSGVSMVEVDMHKVGEFPAYYPFNQRR
ncbi:MAG: thiamine pyrophosphate-binding protein [Acetobacteraceae bacterium]